MADTTKTLKSDITPVVREANDAYIGVSSAVSDAVKKAVKSAPVVERDPPAMMEALKKMGDQGKDFSIIVVDSQIPKIYGGSIPKPPKPTDHTITVTTSFISNRTPDEVNAAVVLAAQRQLEFEEQRTLGRSFSKGEKTDNLLEADRKAAALISVDAVKGTISKEALERTQIKAEVEGQLDGFRLAAKKLGDEISNHTSGVVTDDVRLEALNAAKRAGKAR